MVFCIGSLRRSLYRDLVIVGSIPQQSSEGDGIGDAAQVDEEHSRDGLDMEAVVDITTIPRDLPLDVQPQSTCKPVKTMLLRRQNQSMGVIEP